MIAAARRTIYIENQYFTAPRIAAALEKPRRARRPEVVLVLRLLSHGWLEEATMHVLRTRLIRRLRQVDRFGRFRVYYPHVPGWPKACIDVHSKLMIVDDDWVRIGSANLSSRSMALDTECDLVVESRGQARVAEAIRGFRERLLAEHLDTEPERVREEVEKAGSLNGAIAAFAPSRARCGSSTTCRNGPSRSSASPRWRIPRSRSRSRRCCPSATRTKCDARKPAWGKLAGIVLGILALAAMWRSPRCARSRPRGRGRLGEGVRRAAVGAVGADGFLHSCLPRDVPATADHACGGDRLRPVAGFPLQPAGDLPRRR